MTFTDTLSNFSDSLRSAAAHLSNQQRLLMTQPQIRGALHRIEAVTLDCHRAIDSMLKSMTPELRAKIDALLVDGGFEST